MAFALWNVVGGADKGGILVRMGKELNSSAEAERLSTGAVVEQLELIGDRLRFRLVEGTGPKEGWVSTKITGKALLVPKSDSTAPEPTSPGAEDEKKDSAAGADASDSDDSRYHVRWAVSIDDWEPEGGEQGSEFQYLLQLIKEQSDRDQVLKFRQWEDRKRALLSRLLVRSAAARALQMNCFKELHVQRTKGRKPFLAQPLPPEEEAPNFNVNVSHDGSWVVCASDPHAVVGIDVADVRREDRRGKPIDDFHTKFKTQLSNREWALVRAAGDDLDKQYEVFSRFWAAKEAYVKARGDGLGAFETLSSCEFLDWRPLENYPPGTAYEGGVVVEGRVQPGWHFVQHRLPGQKPHWITIARGPPAAIIDAHGVFTKCLRKPKMDVPRAESPHLAPCVVLPVDALVPAEHRDGYLAAAGGKR